MPIPSTVSDLSATASSNYPTGSESVGPSLDDYIRSHAAIIRQVSDAKADTSELSSYVATADLAANDGASLAGFLQSGTGAIATDVQTQLRKTVFVSDFGVSTSASAADNATRMQAALDHCESTGDVLVGIPGTCQLGAMLTIKCRCDLSMMHFQVNGASVSTAIRVGPATSGQYLFDKDIALPFVTNTAKVSTGWTGFDTSIGIEIANVYQSRILVPYVYNFGVGLKEGGYGVGCVYNTITIGVLYGNKINHQVKPGDASGWSNQNMHIGGRFGHSSGEGTAVSGVKHIELRDYDGTGPAAPNNNLWLNPSIEGNEQEFHLDIQGTFNNFINPRFEAGTAIPARVNFHAISTNETAGNNIIGGYDSGDIAYTFSGAGSSTKNKRIGGTANDSFEYSGNGINLVNKSGSARTAPHIQGFLSSATALGKTSASTDWVYRLHGDGLSVKSSGDTQDRIQLTAAGYLAMGRGSSAPFNCFRAGTSGQANAQVNIEPETDNTITLGAGTKRWKTLHLAALTVATLPTASSAGAGGAAFVTDANATTFASIVAGGGSNAVPVYSDGTNWRIG